MVAPCPLLGLPAELREVILRHAFKCIPHVRVRSPSHRRLRPSRVEKNDPQGLLSTCHTLREESIPLFYSSTTLIFHCSSEAVEYLKDTNIDPFVKANLTHLAIDDGDCQYMTNLLQNHMWLIGNAFAICQSLKALEIRIYARHDATILPATRDLIADWKALSKNCSANTQIGQEIQTTKRIDRDQDETADMAIDRLTHYQYHVRVIESQDRYDGGSTALSNAPPVALSCCNMIMDKDGKADQVLGDAKEAVKRRKARVGAIQQNRVDFDTDTRCPKMAADVIFAEAVEDSLGVVREATDRSVVVGRNSWSSTPTPRMTLLTA